jgi:hypothetical protein
MIKCNSLIFFSLFNKIEARNLIVFARRKPVVFFEVVVEFFALGFNGIKRRLIGALIRDKHKLDKTCPRNIFINSFPTNAKAICSDVFFPQYSIADFNFDLYKKKSSPHHEFDIEVYYAANRWVHCIEALFGNQSEVLNSITAAIEWIDKDIPKSDRAWECYSASERVANLLILLSAKRIHLSDLLKKKLFLFLTESIMWIDSHLEHYNDLRTNNHILNNARAMIMAGVVCDNTIAVERGLLLFSKMSKKLFLKEGFLRERSSHYQIIITNWLLDALHFADQYPNLSKDSIIAVEDIRTLSRKVSDASTLLLSVLQSDKTQIGDISPDMPPVLTIVRLHLLYSIKNKAVTDQCTFIDNWLFIKNQKESLIANITFEKYPFRFPSHGHNDLGSFIWCHENLPVIVDPGRYRYTVDQISLNQITGNGHNTLLVNGLSPLADSLKINGAWFPEKYAKADIKVSLLNKNEFAIEHTGFRRIKGMMVHRRKVKVEASALYVEDHLEGGCTCDIELNWHLSSEFKKGADSRNTLFLNNDGHKLEWESSNDLNIKPVTSITEYHLSSEYGQFEKANRVKVMYRTSLPIHIVTTFKIIK